MKDKNGTLRRTDSREDAKDREGGRDHAWYHGVVEGLALFNKARSLEKGFLRLSPQASKLGEQPVAAG